MTYTSGSLGVVYLQNAPGAGSTLKFYDAGGVIALNIPGQTITTPVVGLVAGDAFELQGAYVQNVLYGSSSLTIVTDTSLYSFSNAPNSIYGSFYGSFDIVTGAERIVLGKFAQCMNTPGATKFWSNTTSWTDGLVPNSGDVSITQGVVIVDRSAQLNTLNLHIRWWNTVLINADVTVKDIYSTNLGVEDNVSVDSTVMYGPGSASLTVNGRLDLWGMLTVRLLMQWRGLILRKLIFLRTTRSRLREN